jgi:2-oxo-4-hydroxy-4-carboxy-5-ureidoimidazoline decarboxylase
VTAEQQLRLERINRLPVADFVSALGGVFEHSPWVAGEVCAARPFATVDALHAAMIDAVRRSPLQVRLDLLRAHPELAGRLARAGELTDDSLAEQGSIGLNRLSAAEFARFDELNRAYREKFGFPFIIAVKEHSKEGIVRSFESRLDNALDTEIENALGQVFRITRLRLAQLVADD